MTVVVCIVLLAIPTALLWRRLVRDPQWPRGVRVAATGALVAMAAVAFVGLGASNATSPGRMDAIKVIGLAWWGVLFYGLVALAGLAVARGLLRLRRRRAADTPPEPVDPERRLFLARSLSGGLGLGIAGVSLSGVRSAWEVETPEVPVRLARLPSALEGFRVAQLSDVHLGMLLGAPFLARVVERTNAQSPDLVVITGDLIEGPPARLAKELAPLADLRARYGVLYVTGNHEYYDAAGVEPWVAAIRSLGVRVLVNERVSIGDARSGGASFDVAGVPDRNAGRFVAAHRPNVARTLAGRDPERELLLLAHQPNQIRDTHGHGVGLQLSGHTHGGQMWPIHGLIAITEPHVAGLHRRDDGTQIYVSRGTGFFALPMRVAAPAEITTLVLTS